MDIKLQKRNHASLRKLTKVDENNNIIEGQDELYVRVEDVPSNLVNSDATPLSNEVFNKINWKDNNALLFTQTDTLPDPISGVTQIVSLNSGQIWCVPGSNVSPFKLGADDLALYLKKNFQAYEAVTVLGSNTKIGALPVNFTNTGNANSSTYLDINDGNIAIKINGAQKHLLNSEKVSFTHGNGEICINDTEVALKHHSDKTTIGLINGSFYIKGNNTQISEDLTNNKLNFYTNLAKAVYGSQNILLEFYSNQVRFLDASNQKEMFNVKQNGELYTNGSTRVIDASIIDSYIENYFDRNFNSLFKEKFIENYVKTAEYVKLFEGSTTSYHIDLLNDSNIYQVYFSESEDDRIMSMAFFGSDINSLSRIYNATTGKYYQPQQIDEDDEGTHYIRVLSYDSLEASNSIVTNIRKVCKY